MKIHWFLIFWMIVSAAGYGQSLPQLEKKYNRLYRQYGALQSELDSLKARLESHATRIDSEKSQSAADKQKIIRLMAEGLEISGQIRTHEEKLRKLQREMGDISLQLTKEYGGQLDSLQQALKAVTEPVRQRELLNRFMTTMTKYIRVSPAFTTLSFDPQRLADIELSAVSDSLEKEIYREILTRAAADIDSHLTYIEKTQNELETLLRLEEKHREFLEETESESYPGSFATALSLNTPRITTDNYDHTAPAIERTAAVSPLASLFRQLGVGVFPTQSEPGEVAPPETGASLSPREFLTLLKAAQQRLLYLRRIVTEKLSVQSQHSPSRNQ